jgi:hypothetical protein
MTYKTGFGLDDWIDTLYTPLGTTGNYSAIAILYTLQVTVTHALGYQFKSHVKSSFHSLIPFLP